MHRFCFCFVERGREGGTRRVAFLTIMNTFSFLPLKEQSQTAKHVERGIHRSLSWKDSDVNPRSSTTSPASSHPPTASSSSSTSPAPSVSSPELEKSPLLLLLPESPSGRSGGRGCTSCSVRAKINAREKKGRVSSKVRGIASRSPSSLLSTNEIQNGRAKRTKKGSSNVPKEPES